MEASAGKQANSALCRADSEWHATRQRGTALHGRAVPALVTKGGSPTCHETVGVGQDRSPLADKRIAAKPGMQHRICWDGLSALMGLHRSACLCIPSHAITAVAGHTRSPSLSTPSCSSLHETRLPRARSQGQEHDREADDTTRIVKQAAAPFRDSCDCARAGAAPLRRSAPSPHLPRSCRGGGPSRARRRPPRPQSRRRPSFWPRTRALGMEDGAVAGSGRSWHALGDGWQGIAGTRPAPAVFPSGMSTYS
eukprot:352088-Chlamydomonas_euryale.AAC.18